eukprot:CAMPEP_0184856486 /NCGR_PEP_ID=MMETSP0580-20130426/1672_1 /TAXON_ID=1118495 /ORGANISM="Dactyliosolen fragilissimus" /LENGTH=78 /DNA_ID=CAMNT_0027351551 /DNA_START=15 /DNA_END=251 /DNA_ORIENTATION=-
MTLSDIREYFKKMDNQTASEFDDDGQKLLPYLFEYADIHYSVVEKVNIINTLIRNFPTCINNIKEEWWRIKKKRKVSK